MQISTFKYPGSALFSRPKIITLDILEDQYGQRAVLQQAIVLSSRAKYLAIVPFSTLPQILSELVSGVVSYHSIYEDYYDSEGQLFRNMSKTLIGVALTNASWEKL